MLHEDREDFGWVGNGTSRSSTLELFKEEVDAARDHGRERPAARGSDVLECVRLPRGAKRGSRVGIDLLPVHFEFVFALEDIPPLILIAVEM